MFQKFQQSPNKGFIITISIFVLIILILLAIIIFRKPIEVMTFDKDKDKIQKDSISLLLEKYQASQVQIDKLNKQFDSLSIIETHIIYRTNEKVKFIFNTLDPNVLDSTIRHSWETKF